jgi:hypothetical protein
MADSGAIRAGRAYVELTTDNSKLQRGLVAAQGLVKNFGASMALVGRGFQNAGAWAMRLGTEVGRAMTAIGGHMKTAGMWAMGMGAAILAPMVMALRTFSNAGHDLLELSERTGMSVEALSELGYAAVQSGADMDILERSVARMQKVIGSAGEGSKAAMTVLSHLGLSLSALKGLSPEEQFNQVAEALSRIHDPTQRAAVAMEMFGRGGTKIIPMLKDGAAGLARLREEAQRYGLSISTEEAERSERFHRVLKLLWMTVQRLAIAIGDELAPYVEDLATWMMEAVRGAIRWVRENGGLIVSIMKLAGALVAFGAAVYVLGWVFSTIGAVITGTVAVITTAITIFSLVAEAIAFICTPVGAVVVAVSILAAALVALALYGLYASGVLGKALSWLGERFGVLKEDALAAWEGIANALASGDIGLAARILWLTLKMEWQRGVVWLKEYWEGWKVSFLNVATDAFYGLQAAWVIVTSKIAQVWTETVAMLKTVWSVFVGLVRLGWNRTQKSVGLIDEKEYAENRAKIVKETDSELADIGAGLAKRSAEVEQNRTAALIDISGKATAARAKHKADADRELAESEAELAKARAEWQNALDEAKRKRTASQPPGPKAPPKFNFKGGAGAIEDLKVKMGVAGSFSSAAAFGLVGVGSIERIAKATEDTAANTKDLVEMFDQGGSTFE